MEQVVPKRRELGGAVIVWAYGLGMTWLGLLAWALRDWNQIILALYAPALLFTSYFWYVTLQSEPEISPQLATHCQNFWNKMKTSRLSLSKFPMRDNLWLRANDNAFSGSCRSPCAG